MCDPDPYPHRNLPHRDNKKADGETPAAPEVETPPPADDGPMGSAEDATMNMDPGAALLVIGS